MTPRCGCFLLAFFYADPDAIGRVLEREPQEVFGKGAGRCVGGSCLVCNGLAFGVGAGDAWRLVGFGQIEAQNVGGFLRRLADETVTIGRRLLVVLARCCRGSRRTIRI